MIRDYQVVSPSLEGILRHESIIYDGIRRSPEIDAILDRPSKNKGPHKHEIINQYFHDLYGILMKKISQFVIESGPADNEAVKLQAMLQELIKVKRLL